MAIYKKDIEANNYQIIQISKKKNLIKILAIKIYAVNNINTNYFIYFTQFNIKELKTYIETM